MSRISTVSIKDIEANPFRKLGTYPYVERKIETLQRSIEDVGLWEGVIARERNDKYQLAFGHHRIEAARRNKLKEVALIVRALTDEQMLQLMGRENMEDYNADFLCMLETWEAAVNFSVSAEKSTQAVDIAQLLGWIYYTGDNRKMNETARATSAAQALMNGGYLAHNDLKDLTVDAAKQILERAQSNMNRLEEMGRTTKREHKDIERAKKQVAKGAKETARDVRRGQVEPRNIRGRVDFHSYKYAQEDKKISPMFTTFGQSVRKQIQAMLKTDNVAEKLGEIIKSINLLTQEEDFSIVRGIDFDLSELPRRAELWRKKMIPTDKKVIQLLEVNRGK